MKKFFTTTWAMTVASMKMYFRDFTALFFSLVFPVIFLLVFGYVNSSDVQLNIAIINNADTQFAQQFEDTITNIEIINVNSQIDSVDSAREALAEEDINYALVIPSGFGEVGNSGMIAGEIQGYYTEGDTFNDTVSSIVNDVLRGFNEEATFQSTGERPVKSFSLVAESISSDELDAIDYLIPGIVAFSILSLGIFSISQGFITYKSSGALRRLHVTPVSPFRFIIAQSLTRLVVVALNVIIMLLLAIWLFDFSINGSLLLFMLVALYGTVMFMGMGFAIAGWAKNENQAAPISNIIFFPMMFLSGTFFPRELFPEWLQPVTNFLPLSYLADALRDVANTQASVGAIGPELLGMTVWAVISYAIAVAVFRWE